MRFSILMPVYKAEAFLEASTASVLAQEGDYELVLVEDGSPDGSGALCDRLAAQNPGRVRALHLPHRGLVPTRRSAIQAARGEYILWLDADDALEPDAVRTLSGALDADPELDMILYEFRCTYENGREPQGRPPLFEDGRVFAGEEEKQPLYELLIRSDAINSIWSKCVRATLYKSDPVDYTPCGENPFNEDAIQTLYPLTAARRILYLQKPLYGYLMQDASIMHGFDPSKLAMRYNPLKFRYFAPFMKSWGLYDREHRILLKASSYKGVLDNVLYFWQSGCDRKALKAFVSEFAESHPELKSLAKSKVLPLSWRGLFTLFVLKRPDLIAAGYRVRRGIKQLRG